MSQIPAEYSWLWKEPAPALLLAALKMYGTQEAPGPLDNPVILGWAKEVGLDHVYKHDETPWCGLFVATAVHRAGLEGVQAPLWAKSWAQWGMPVKNPMLGDILVFERPGGGGHVGIYVGEDRDAYHVLGGNQRDEVNITRIFRGRLIAARRTPWRVAQPQNVRRVFLAPTGLLSKNEA